MFDKPQSTHVLSLDIDGIFLKGVALTYPRGKPKLEKSFEIQLELVNTENEQHVKPLYMKDQKAEIEAFAEKYLIVTSINTQDVLIRPLDLKLKKQKDIDSVLAFQAEPLLPYAAENAILDKIILSSEKEGSKLSVVAVRKDHLTQHIDQWKAQEIEPEVISADPAALAFFAKQFVLTDNPLYVLHLGLINSLCILIEQGKLIAAQAIPFGIDSLTDALTKEKGIDNQKASEQLNDDLQALLEENSALKNVFDGFRSAITRTVYALAKLVKGRDIHDLLVVGPGALTQGVTQTLCGHLNKTFVTLADNLSFGMNANDLKKFALPLGAALSAMPKSCDQINFRQQEFVYPAPWKRLKKTVGLYLLLCCLLAVALMAFGKSYISYQEGEIKRQYIQLLNVMNKPYNEFEKEFFAKTQANREGNLDEIKSLSELSPSDINSRLNFLEKEIQATPQTFPLQPNVPRVSDVLAWIATHPSFVNKSLNSKESQPSLQIESLNYTMVKRPEPTKKQDKYQVKVELEFSSPTPKMAREFHDALIAPNDIMDPKAEIKWNSNRDRYRTSFYLKDRTSYPGQ